MFCGHCDKGYSSHFPLRKTVNLDFKEMLSTNRVNEIWLECTELQFSLIGFTWIGRNARAGFKDNRYKKMSTLVPGKQSYEYSSIQRAFVYFLFNS